MRGKKRYTENGFAPSIFFSGSWKEIPKSRKREEDRRTFLGGNGKNVINESKLYLSFPALSLGFPFPSSLPISQSNSGSGRGYTVVRQIICEKKHHLLTVHRICLLKRIDPTKQCFLSTK